MNEADWHVIGHPFGPFFLWNQSDAYCVDEGHVRRSKAMEALENCHDVRFYNGPASSVEDERETIWAQCLILWHES